jgi:hypothetical protein
MSGNQFQIISRPRHLRYIFFIDEKFPYENLFDLIHMNQRIWGGRYNPIVPVSNNIISKEYIEVIKYYDPDYIFYSNDVDVSKLKELKYFNPCGYYCLDDKPRVEEISGVNSLYFLSQFHTKSKIIFTSETWSIESPLISFYQINFGLTTGLYSSDYEISKDFDRTIVGKEEFQNLNKLIHEQKPINQSLLSRRNLNTVILRSKEHLGNNNFEVVIAKDKLSIIDLLYYWNRLLFQMRNILYITIEELNLLCEDKYFGGVLYDMDYDSNIRVVSNSLSREEVLEIIHTKLKKTTIYRSFEYFPIARFPFEVLDASGLYERDYAENQNIQMIPSDKSIFYLPKLSFTDKVGFNAQKWAIDIELKKSIDEYKNSLKYSFSTDTFNFFREVKGRINKRRNISIFIHNQINTANTLELRIPSFRDLMRQIISMPVIDGVKETTEFIYSGLHDSSFRLSAFIKLFKNDFSAIEDFFSDKFWVSIFEHLSTNNEVAGEAISFDEIIARCIDILAENGITLGKKSETSQNYENLEKSLKYTIKELCDYRVFLRGFKLKCRNCSSEFWYHIKEVDETINCIGCLQDFDMPIEPKFSYKLNDLIKNNIFQSKKQRDGNLTVIRTLINLHEKARNSFDYTPQLNLYIDDHSNKPFSDLDIVCVADGSLILGEAKHNSSGFFVDKMKSLHSLVAISKAIRPDKIVLTCYEDSNGKLEKAKQSLIHLFNKWEFLPEVDAFMIHTPDYFNLNSSRYFYY